MNILINGASISAEYHSWPYHIQKSLNCEMTNLSMPSCGNDYVHDTTISEIGLRKYDLVLVMWPAVSLRTDWKVSDITQFGYDSWTSTHHGNNTEHREHIERDWVFGGCHVVEERQNVPPEMRSLVSRFFSDYYSIVKPPQLMRTALIKMITLESVLKAQGIPYVFMTTAPQKSFERFSHLEKMIDQSNYFNDEHIMTYCKRLGFLDPSDETHPTETGHKAFADLLLEHLKNKKYV